MLTTESVKGTWQTEKHVKWTWQTDKHLKGNRKLENQHAKLTELATPSWPLNLRRIWPVATSQENTERSPPHEASLYGHMHTLYQDAQRKQVLHVSLRQLRSQYISAKAARCQTHSKQLTPRRSERCSVSLSQHMQTRAVMAGHTYLSFVAETQTSLTS